MTMIGAPMPRVDGHLKVTGTADYAADFTTNGLVHGVMIQSTIAKGRIAKIETQRAEQLPDVLAVLTHANTIKLPAIEDRVSVLQNDLVHYNRQPIALAVADTLESAQLAASLITVQYEAEPPDLDFFGGFAKARTGSHNNEPGDMSWGDLDKGLKDAQVRIDELYTTPIEHHVPMEPHATLAEWNGDHLTLHDATQNIFGVQHYVASAFGLPDDDVHVITPYVGGGFGCKGQVWSHVLLAALAAKQLRHAVRLVLDRPQTFGPVGARPRTHQRITLGATKDGRLTAVRHEVHTNTSVLEDYLESSAFPTRVMYSCPNVSTVSRIVPLNLGTPTYMRAPGVATGTYALEVAMDELAYRLKIDPLELRLLNYAEADPHSGNPFTEKSLRSCYTRGAELFGWAKRNHEPRSMMRGTSRVGWGMATETYPANRMRAEASVRVLPNGRVIVSSGTEDIGTGMYTIMSQVCADALGVPVNAVEARLGDTDLPKAPLAAGSMSTASVMPAVRSAALAARENLLRLALDDPQSSVYGLRVENVQLIQGQISSVSQPGRIERLVDLLERHEKPYIEGFGKAEPPKDLEKLSHHSFGAIFAEVVVDADLGMVKVERIVAVYDVGRVLNPRTARNQFIGGIVWGVSLALHENSSVDTATGRIANANLADYLVPVNADIGEIDVSTIDVPDVQFNELGARGIGEIGITGTGAAIANAVFHATGKRIRDLPITVDKLLI
jgi:xanthine dehydrogenase YagR molybdenum-binding subunit